MGPIEERALIPGSEARPADDLIPKWSEGRDTALDITVVNYLRSALVNVAAKTPDNDLKRRF